MNINNQFQIGQVVYLKTDPEQQPAIVTALFVTNREVIYQLSMGLSTSNHYEIEINKERDILKSII